MLWALDTYLYMIFLHSTVCTINEVLCNKIFRMEHAVSFMYDYIEKFVWHIVTENLTSCHTPLEAILIILWAR